MLDPIDTDEDIIDNKLLLRYSAPQWVGEGIPEIPYVDK
jgi:hypothetical protein